MYGEPALDRRATPAEHRGLRSTLAALRAGLYRQLADDDDRAAYWVRHVRSGVVLSEISAIAVLVYALLTSTGAHNHPVILGLGAAVVVTSPLLLLLPIAAMVRDRRGPLFFYAWSIVVTGIVTVITRIDGGPTSPLFSLLFITLAYMAAAYPPYGVVAIGALMTGSYLLFVALPHLTGPALFFAVVMAAYTMMCTLASANAWAAYDRQVELLRTHEILAATDPLTGCPNRRVFLSRLAQAIASASGGGRSVVCLIDLDGFKAVNDRHGHAVGDAALVAVTGALAGAVREGDILARLGGDEFAVLADVVAPARADELAERLRDAVAAVGVRYGVTASVGVAEVDPGDDVNLLLHRADAAMYRAKTSGGNRVTALAR